MKILIGIATYHRIEKLHRCIKSIKASTHQDFEIMVVCDNLDLDTAEEIKAIYPEIIVDVQPSHKYVIGAWNLCIQSNINEPWDAFLGLCDDVELNPDALEQAIKVMSASFKDGDGVVGFKQECPGYPNYTFTWYGQTLIGRKFIERYKEVDYQICAPMYKHFYQDQELFEYANSLNKFEKADKAILKHYHPGFIKEEHDETHDVIRKGKNSPKKYDIELFNKRQKENKIWGLSWEL